MGEQIKLTWKYRETNDSEYARSRYKGFDIEVQDCDGDISRWHIKRGDQYLLVGEEHGQVPYHFDAAQEKVQTLMQHVWAAVELNDFVQNEMPKLRAAGQC